MMIERKGILFIGLAFVILFGCQPIGVQSHTPESMTLEYDWDTQVLTVNVEHNVTDPLTHYISKIIVFQNNFSCIVETKLYENQSSTEGMSDTFEIPTAHGDSLSATAYCVEGEIVHEYIVVTDPNHTDTPTSTTDSTTDGAFTPSRDMFIAIAIVAGVICVIAACIIYGANKVT